MKILVDNSINQIEARDLGFYLGSKSHHKGENALNDIPSVEWVAGYPAVANPISYSSSLGRLSIEVDFNVEGNGALGSFYVGKFTADRLSMSIRHNIDLDSLPSGVDPDDYEEPIDNAYPFSNHNSFPSIQIPIRVYNTLSDFVRGQFVRYHDYFRTLEEIMVPSYELHDPSGTTSSVVPDPSNPASTIPNKHSKTIGYVARSYQMRFKFIMENQNVPNVDSFYFQLSSSNSIGYSETIDGTSYDYVELIGRFMVDSSTPLSYNDEFFIEPMDIGSYVIGKQQNYSNPNDLFQIIKIKGDGTTPSSVSLISRKLSSQASLLPANTENSSGLYTIHTCLRSLRLGLIRCGYYESFPNAQVGLTKNYKDFSVRTELVNGGHQYINRNISKNYSGSMILDRERVIKFLKFAEKQRAKPFPVEVLTGMIEESPTSMFCVFEQMPDENMSYRTGVLRDISFNLKQIH